MQSEEIVVADQPDLTRNDTDTGSGLQDEQETFEPGTPEYLGHMAKRGGASVEEVSMIVNARKAELGITDENDNSGAPAEDSSGSTQGDTNDNGETDESTDEGDKSGDESDDNDADDSEQSTPTLAVMQQEVMDNGGKLTDSTLDKLEAAGFKRSDIESYVADQYKTAQDLAVKSEAEMYAGIGGKEAYIDMVNWAGTNMTANEATNFNKALDSGDMSVMKDAMSGLKSRYDAANGTQPKTKLRGNNPGSSASADVYRSQAQLSADMSNPKYKKDPAFRQMVFTKLGRSPQFRMG